MVALLSLAVGVVGADISDRALEQLAAELHPIVSDPAESARAAHEALAGRAAHGGSASAMVIADPVCRSLLDTLWANRVLFAVLADDSAQRRVLEYGYVEDVAFPGVRGLGERLAWANVAGRAWHPDRRVFVVECSGLWRGQDGHVEVRIPEELRFSYAALHDVGSHQQASVIERGAEHVALHPSGPIESGCDEVAIVEIAPTGGSRTRRATLAAIVVSAMLWLGVASGLDGGNTDATVSLLLGGAAAYAGIAAALGEPRLVSEIFSGTRRWLSVVVLAALGGSTSLAMSLPHPRPVGAWLVAAAVCTIAAARLAWGARWTRS